MGEIQFMEKPEWISWEEVRECMRSSHQTNTKLGFEMLNSKRTVDDLKNKMKVVHLFVAIDDKKLVGLAGAKLIKMNKWWTRNVVSYHCFDAILPDYRGTDVYIGLKDIRDRFDKQNNVRIFQFNTAEHNKTIIRLTEKKGYKRVQFAPTGEGANYYSITMVKWSDGCPHKDWFVVFMYKLSKFVSKTFWTPGYKLKFWFH